MKAFSRKEGVFLLLLFLFALGLRLVYLGQLRGSPMFDAPIMDAKYHDEWAQSIQKDWLQSTTPFHTGPFFRAPLYAYFLALIYTIFGHSYLAAGIVQLLMGSLSCLLIYWLGKKTFNPLVGKIAGVLAAAYGTFIYFEGELLIPVLILFLDLALILAVLSAEKRPGWWRWHGGRILRGGVRHGHRGLGAVLVHHSKRIRREPVFESFELQPQLAGPLAFEAFMPGQQAQGQGTACGIAMLLEQLFHLHKSKTTPALRAQ